MAQKDLEIEQAGPDDVYTEGTVGRIAQLLRRPDGTIMVAVQVSSGCVLWGYAEEPYLSAEIEVVHEETLENDDQSLEIEALRRNAVEVFQRLLSLNQQLPEELGTYATGITDARHVAYLIAGSIRMDLETRQQILELASVREKLLRLTEVLNHELQVLELGRQIQDQAQEHMSKAQREYFLREQLRAIQRELGEEDDQTAEVNRLRERTAEVKLSDEARKQVDRELGRLERLPPASPEHSIIRTYVEMLLDLPWSVSTEGEIDAPGAPCSTGPLRSGASRTASWSTSPFGSSASECRRARTPTCVSRYFASSAHQAWGRPARPEHRPRARAQVRADEPGRCAR
ncbi:MAG: LON peptidase substrate-binding domain-containing protein [Chloroflexia bacterium]